MTDPLVAAILGVVEGITEFLPVSSTGHLLITERILFHSAQKPDWLDDLFNIVIQTGAVLAVIPLFHQRFHQFIFNWRDKAVRDYFLKIVVAFFITGVGGYVMEKKGFKLPEQVLPIAVALLVGGVLFLIVERWLAGRGGGQEKDRGDLRNVTWTVAVAVGIGQLIAAAFPGSSRSGTTIIFSLALGLGRPLATEYSFLVSIPTMLAAGGYKIFEAFHHAKPGAAPENWHMVILSTVIAAVVSFIAVKWLLRYVQTHTFNAFGWYRILAGVGVFVALALAPK
ncbi:MAG TPA: undecaprenyl-diphosphate phosphatase [Verrucomicrobiae bacterium]|jgi:undecaprenyl-diphosphatase|nr:undecaprenyl-diphosphate phosphatase [Verrucomicrobiae bacterium]